jgi:hypothetical protein
MSIGHVVAVRVVVPCRARSMARNRYAPRGSVWDKVLLLLDAGQHASHLQIDPERIVPALTSTAAEQLEHDATARRRRP